MTHTHTEHASPAANLLSDAVDAFHEMLDHLLHTRAISPLVYRDLHMQARKVDTAAVTLIAWADAEADGADADEALVPDDDDREADDDEDDDDESDDSETPTAEDAHAAPARNGAVRPS